ncbi:hypothetical protein Tco_1184313 [Tanacetum coccineum]
MDNKAIMCLQFWPWKGLEDIIDIELTFYDVSLDIYEDRNVIDRWYTSYTSYEVHLYPWFHIIPEGFLPSILLLGVDLNGDEDPIDEDGDIGMGDSTGVSASLGGKSSSGRKKMVRKQHS